MRAVTCLVLLALLAAAESACGTDSSSPTLTSSPTAPSPPPAPTPTPTPTPTPPQPSSSTLSAWKVTQSFVSVTGPDNCWVREQRQRWTGAVFSNLEMTVTRSEGSIKLESVWFQVNYQGTFAGSAFSASGGPLSGGGSPCQDGTLFQQMPGVSNLSGTFSADDREMTATESNAYVLTTGDAVTYTWSWQARRN